MRVIFRASNTETFDSTFGILLMKFIPSGSNWDLHKDSEQGLQPPSTKRKSELLDGLARSQIKSPGSEDMGTRHSHEGFCECL